MKVINQNETNSVVVTATENATLASPYWLLVFTSEATNSTNTCICTNLSGYTDRYDKFSVIENDTENRTAGTLSLKPEGTWTLEVYEQSSSSNLDPANATTMCHRERVFVKGTATEYDKTYTTGETTWSTWNGTESE